MYKQIIPNKNFLAGLMVVILCFTSACVTPDASIQKQPPQQEGEKYIRFQCPGQYIQFEYPASWNFTSGCTNDWGGDYSINNPTNNSEIGIFINGPVVSGVIQIEKWNDYEYNSSFDSLIREYGDRIIINRTMIGSVHGMECNFNQTFGISGDRFLLSWDKTTILHYRRYTISYESPSKTFNTDYSVAKHVMDSFTFIEPEKQ